MPKGDQGKHGHKPDAAGGASRAAADDKAAKAERRRAKKVVKVELQLADAREIQAAVGALVATLEHKLAELNAPAEAAPPGPAATPARSTRAAPRPRSPRPARATPRVPPA